MHKKCRRFLLMPVLMLGSCALTAQEPTNYTNALGMEFVRIAPGSMVVGRYQPTVGKPNRSNTDRKWLPDSVYQVAAEMAAQAAMPGFEVTIAQPYYIGKYEVTQAQWQQVMGSNPSFFQDTKVDDDASLHPVENITWQDAQAFIRKLNDLDKKHTYRLPSEFEWEYAARAGAEDDIPWDEMNKVAVKGGSTTSAVGQKEPNAWGLYDMLGNVWEWVQDYYNEKIFADPVPPQTGEQHVLKGASFTGDAKNATYKTHAAGPGNGFDVGLRVLMEAKSK